MKDKPSEAQERIAKELSSFDNLPWESLKDKTRTLFDGNTQSTYLRRAYLIHKVYEELGYRKPLDRPKLKEKIQQEICCVCIHKPTSIEEGLFEDSPKTLKGTGCTYEYDEDSGLYCQLVIKCANKILAIMIPKDKPLFRAGSFKLHSGDISDWKIDCDALTDKDINTLAKVISGKFSFGRVWGIPRGGTRLANALLPYVTEGKTIIVDDVLTTGNSMKEAQRVLGEDSIGVVIFARNKCPDWITPIFQLWENLLPKDKPPLLSDEEIVKATGMTTLESDDELAVAHDICQAQREADIKHYKGE